MSNIAQKTADFSRRREQRNAAQKVILNLDTISNDEFVGGVIKGMETFETFSRTTKGGGNSDSQNELAKRTEKMLKTSKEDFDAVLNGKGGAEETEPIEKDFDNFYGPIIAQSASVHSRWLLGKSNGLLDYRNVTNKALSTEAQGIVSMALNTVLQINTGDADEIDSGWVELYDITDALIGKSSARIINLSNHLRVKKLKEGAKITTSQPLSTSEMDETKYERYGIAMLYSTFEQELTDYFQSANGVNRIFSAFRTAMALTKSKEAYRYITRKPEMVEYTMDSKDFKDAPDPNNSTFTERLDYKVERFIMNLTLAYRAFVKQMKADGISIGSPRPTVHAVYNPDAAGATIISKVLQRLTDPTKPIAMNANIVFHESMEAPLCGAWELIKNGKEVKLDPDGFEERLESASEDSFGLMLVLPKGGNIHGINNQLYNISMEYPENETVGYFTFERYTFHADPRQRFWLKNIVPASEATLIALENGE